MLQDLVGQTFGQLLVLSRNSSKNKKVYWDVSCKLCDQKYVNSADVIKKNVGGCISCVRKNTPKGIDSASWRGGKYISSNFLSNVKYGAKKRNIDCVISLDELDKLWEAQEGKCAYTNRELTLSGDECTASLDRIDSSEGYYLGNVQFVHKTVNVMKWALPENEFLEFIKEIYEFKVNDGNRIYQEQLSLL